MSLHINWYDQWKYVGEGEYGPKYEYQGADKMSANEQQVAGNHYKGKAVQPWDYIAGNNIGYLAGNAIKYLSRYKEKGGADDIRKAIHYCQKLLEVEYPDK